MINIRFEIQGWEFTLQDSSQVGNSLGWPAYQWMPDGHLSTLWVGLSSSSCLLYPYLPQLPPDLIDCIYPIQLFINKWTDDSLKTFRWTELNNGCCFTRIPTHIVVCKNTLSLVYDYYRRILMRMLCFNFWTLNIEQLEQGQNTSTRWPVGTGTHLFSARWQAEFWCLQQRRGVA